MHYKNKNNSVPLNTNDIRWKGEYADHIEKPAKSRKGLPFPKPKRKRK